MSDSKVRVRFVTQHKAYAVSDAPFAVPAKLTRNGLSKVVNHLLNNVTADEDDEVGSDEVSFDFLLHNRLIRMSLEKAINSMKLSTEDIITIEYFPSISVDKESKSCDMPAWVGCMSTNLSNDGLIVAGCYDGMIRLVDSNEISPVNIQTPGSKSTLNTSITMSSLPQHEGPIKDVCAFSHKSHYFVVSCGKDQKMKCFMSGKKNSSSGMSRSIAPFRQVASLSGHVSSVECLDVYSDNSALTVVSGGYDGNVFGYHLHDACTGFTEADAPAATKNTPGKKSKLNSGASSSSSFEVADISSSFHVHAHAQVVTDIQLFHNSTSGSSASVPSHMLTSSFDHSLKLWDLTHQDNISTFNTAKVVTSLHYSMVNRLILTSHTDDKIRLFDPNSNSSSGVGEDVSHSNLNGSCVKTFGVTPSVTSKMPPQWISQVRWHPTSAHLFASVDYSGAVKLWDMRTLSVPLHTLKSAHDGKGLCVDWVRHSDSSASIVSGGSDCCVKSLGINGLDSLSPTEEEKEVA